MHRPSEAHMDAVQRILKYLKSAPGKGLMFSNHGHQEVEGYTDADWAGSVTDRRSTSGYVTFVGGNLVTWRTEFRGMAHGVQELLWLKILLRELGFNSTKPSNLYCDNKAAISIAHNLVQHDRTKHVEVDRHFIKERLVDGTINLPYVKSDDQLADILTKAVSSRIFHLSLSKLGIRDIYAPT
ncbi:gag-pol polyprotein [Pyrus ussuriensis x Pyrus communis]|uniref:Gag-pol polyprotein n=1 Tax=Pyrus ussuriensis x Pyrus communis TaxID=2448454 RepID=A0A5N5GQE7_9ROSA|nr:gag-pol polyprotein [Pyrus ussuriensis x Pyrus communis]